MKKATGRRGQNTGRPTPPAPSPPPSLAEFLDKARALRESDSKDPNVGQVDGLLDQLRRRRLFKDLADTGSILAKRPNVSATTLRLTAQALIELGKFDSAEETLHTVIRQHSNAAEALEAHGLIGRIAKQRYVNAYIRERKGDPEDLRRAAGEYLRAYDGHPDRPVWHGVNAVALLHRAHRDEIRGLPDDRMTTLATAIVKQLEPAYSEKTEYWDVATIAEASLALGKHDQAELWFNRAAWHPRADAFALASTIRQLREVWQLDAVEPPGSRILPALDARLHAVGQTRLLSGETLAKAPSIPFEKVFGDSPFMPHQALALALECAKSVCRVEDRLGQGIGTGFLVRGKSLGAKPANELLLVTNAHVLSEDGSGDSLTPQQAHVAFYANVDRQSRPHTASVKRIHWSSPRDKLDATIAQLDKPPKVDTELSLSSNLPSPDSNQKVYVIGHPCGGGLMFSLNDNDLLDHGAPDDPRVHYKTPTEPGSSGSPVFNAVWQLIALHHAGDKALPKIHGSGTYEANEGIGFGHILAGVKAG